MKDPIGSFGTIKNNFIRYVETAFRTRFESVEEERRALLNFDKVLYRMPWIEPLPDYASSSSVFEELKKEDLAGELSDLELQTFKGLVSCGLFPSKAKPYLHQAKMLKEALRGNNCVITSGTGSGKTESFLLPLFAQLSKELSKWASPNPKPETVNTWWRSPAEGGLTPTQIVDTNSFTLSSSALQRHNETRPAGVRALILYPMNALVEDQMSRLRKALDSDDARDWLRTNMKDNAIYFGRYNGNSPVAGELRKIDDRGRIRINTTKVNKLVEQLQQIWKDSERVKNYIEQENLPHETAKDLKSFFQRLDGSEMRCRFDMQLAPPDILITNYSMLSIMLMRAVDSGIFDKTRSWLACEDLPNEQVEAAKKDRIFHLIIDELHLYRGTQGTEVAYLLKLVLDRLGLHPHHPQLRILASSASLESGDNEEGRKSKKFLEDFFGIDSSVKPFTIIEGESKKVASVTVKDEFLPLTPFSKIAEAFDTVKGDTKKVAFATACESSATLLEEAFDFRETGSGVEKLLRVIINPSLKIKERLYTACENDGGKEKSYRATCSIRAEGDEGNETYFAEKIFGSTNSVELLINSLRGLLISRALLDEPAYKMIAESITENEKLPRFRFHYFFRNIEGIWASVKPEDVDADFIDSNRTAGKLYSTSRINSDSGHRVLELLYCDNCGTTLFGGSRLVTSNSSGNHTFELLPISPNIEGIPEKTPAKLLEKRSYQEYAVFWPCGKQQFTPHDPEHGIPANFWRQTTLAGLNQTDFEANWVPASLHNISGDIEFGAFGHENAIDNPNDWIKGYYFTITRDNSGQDIALPDATGNVSAETHKALPNACPACGVNHQNRRQDWPKRKNSSIRGFRTGFAKTTQMFAKELMYQLPSTEAERKLVVFSDSREDAAQIANGIERNHYTDLLREILVIELHTNLMLRHRIVRALETEDTTSQEELRRKSELIFDEVEDLFDKSNYSGLNTIKQKEKRSASAKLDEYRSLLINVRELVHITNSLNLAPFIKHFVNLGINPSGSDISLQTAPFGGGFIPWYELINFENGEWRDGVNNDFISRIQEGTFTNLASMFFGSLFYSFESSALGYVTVDPNSQNIVNGHNLGIQKGEYIDIVNSTIRILGDKYKHNKLDDNFRDSYPFNFTDYARLPGQIRRYIREVADRLSKSERELGTAIFNTLSTSGLLNGERGIVIEDLFVKVAVATDFVWTSPRGNRPHLHSSGGVCTYSLAQLTPEPDKTCNDIWEKNYLAYNAIKEKRPPIRLHCEELTGQTDDQFERQRHFRNIILPDEGNKKVKTIDLLSVTTTLEVGVDIGSLQSVMLGNMPPQRFNYQQRVGRAGRRGQAYSAILTFCRGRSHDEFYFSNPQKITGDAPPTPFLTMGQERIFKRLLAKETLRRAYLNIPTNVNNDEGLSSVHGEFGSIGDLQVNWRAYKTQIIAWITANRKQIENIVDALITPELHQNRDNFVDWILNTTDNNGLIEKVQSVINNEEITTSDISEKLAEGGILPMFGMPTTVRNLYHSINNKLTPLSIDRSGAMSIYEFAPGAQKTKDKAIHSVIGFTTEVKSRLHDYGNANYDGSPFSSNKWMSRCRNCGDFRTYNSENDTQQATTNCQNCGEQGDKYQRPVMLKAPKAYRTNLSKGRDLKDDADILLSRPPIFAETNNTDSKIEVPEEPIYNTAISISDRDITWRINTNSDSFFEGRLYEVRNRFPFGNSQGYRFSNQWITENNARNYIDDNGYSMNVFPVDGSTIERIAIGSHKSTEVLRISPSSIPLELDLNMFTNENDLPFVKAQANGVRSGFYSAAFLLQRILGDKLDIDPSEIEIADISMKPLDDGTYRRTAEIVLSDELPNGSGFVRYLFKNFHDLLDEAIAPEKVNSYLGKIHSVKHQQNCKDACYDCLKVYRNMNYHSLLDWRLGLSILRILKDPNYACGTDMNFDDCIELNGWLDSATKLMDNFSSSFDLGPRELVNGLPVIKTGINHRNIIMIVHPFWDLKNIMVDNWIAEVKAELDDYASNRGGELSIIDSFNLHRRPGWCYEKLVR